MNRIDFNSTTFRSQISVKNELLNLETQNNSNNFYLVITVQSLRLTDVNSIVLRLAFTVYIPVNEIPYPMYISSQFFFMQKYLTKFVNTFTFLSHIQRVHDFLVTKVEN